MKSSLIFIAAILFAQTLALDKSNGCIVNQRRNKEPLHACVSWCKEKHGPDTEGVCKGQFCACVYYEYVELPESPQPAILGRPPRPPPNSPSHREIIVGTAQRRPPIPANRVLTVTRGSTTPSTTTRRSRIPVGTWRTNSTYFRYQT